MSSLSHRCMWAALSLGSLLGSNSVLASEQPEWTHTVGPYALGERGIAAVDLDADGVSEVVMTATSRIALPYENTHLLLISEKDGSGHRITHATALPAGHMFHDGAGIHPFAGFTVIRDPAGDRIVTIIRDYEDQDGDSVTMQTFAGKPLTRVASVSVQSNFLMDGIADVDGDGSLEVYGIYDLHPLDSGPSLLDYATGAFEWGDNTRAAVDVAVGQFDADPPLELVFGTGDAVFGNFGPGYVIDGASHATEWTFNAGFKGKVRVGNFSGSRSALEFVALGSQAQIFSTAGGFAAGASFALPELGWFASDIVDVTGDQLDEIVVGQGQDPRIIGYTPSTGAEVLSIDVPGNADVMAFAIGQLDPSRAGLEIAHASYSSGWPRLYRVRTLQGNTELFDMHTTVGPMSTLARANLDGTGGDEIVSMTSGAARLPSDEGGTNDIVILDAQSGREIRARDNVFGSASVSGGDRVELAVANMDADPQLEIIAVASIDFGVFVGAVVLDSQSLAVQWSQDWSVGKSFAMSMVNANGDAIPDIALLVADRVIVFNGVNGSQLWETSLFAVSSTGPASLVSGNFDADPALEIAAASGSTVRIIDMASHGILRNVSSASPAVGQWVEGVGPDCRHVLMTATMLSRRDCLTGNELSSRALSLSTEFGRPLVDSNGPLVLSDGRRLVLQDGASVIAESADWGLFLGHLNRGSALLVGGIAQVVVGNDYGIARFDFSPYDLFTDEFE